MALFRNTKYTVLEIVVAAGFEEPIEFGKFAVKISGISGYVDPNKVILISKGTEKLTVVFKGETKEVELADAPVEEGKPENVQISDAAKASIKKAGEEATKRAAEIAKKKAAAKEEKVEVKVEEEPKQ